MANPLDRETLARIAPKLAELSQNVLFNDIWTREPLSPRERSLVTLGALTALGRVQQLPWHIRFAQQNGLTREEIVEVLPIWHSTPAGPRRFPPSNACKRSNADALYPH